MAGKFKSLSEAVILLELSSDPEDLWFKPRREQLKWISNADMWWFRQWALESGSWVWILASSFSVVCPWALTKNNTSCIPGMLPRPKWDNAYYSLAQGPVLSRSPINVLSFFLLWSAMALVKSTSSSPPTHFRVPYDSSSWLPRKHTCLCSLRPMSSFLQNISATVSEISWSLPPHCHDPNLGTIFPPLDAEALSLVFCTLPCFLTSQPVLPPVPAVLLIISCVHACHLTPKSLSGLHCSQNTSSLTRHFSLYPTCSISLPLQHAAQLSSFAKNVVHLLFPWCTPTYHSDLPLILLFPVSLS